MADPDPVGGGVAPLSNQTNQKQIFIKHHTNTSKTHKETAFYNSLNIFADRTYSKE